MARVYQALKARVMAGEFAPGERIDPARMSAELAASATPIRDALHRLAGERLVESWQYEGFRQPAMTEAGLRDLYGWSEDLIRIVLRAVERQPTVELPTPQPGSELPNAIASVFTWLAQSSPNHEHGAAIASLNDRCHSIRIVEQRILPDSSHQLLAFQDMIIGQRWPDARRWTINFHAARLRHVADIAAGFRRREI